MFALVDVNSFYASCEQAFRPELDLVPVVVASNNYGCVIARSALAKKLCIKTSVPLFKYAKFFRWNGVVCFSSNYELQGDMSHRLMFTLEEICPRVSVYSIDEAFCDLTGVCNCRDLTDFGREIKQTVYQRTFLHVGVGIAPTKTLAKLANHAAKTWKATCGVVDLSNVSRQRTLLPCGEVWGIRSQISKKLEAMGIKTALQLADADICFIRKHFSVMIERTVRELRGESCLEFDEFQPAKQEICCSRPFGQRVNDCTEMCQAIVSYATRAAEKLRGEYPFCRYVSVFVKTSLFALDGPYYGKHAGTKLLTPTKDTRDIVAAAVRCLDAVWRDGHR